MVAGWTRSDVLTAVGIVVAVLVGIAGVWAALFSPQFQRWWRSRKQGNPYIALDLSDAKPYEVRMSVGVANATTKTLAEVEEALPEGRMQWLHEKDFGNSFTWMSVRFLEEFTWKPEAPAREFLDQELELLRLKLVSSAKHFLSLAAIHTDDIDPHSLAGVHKIPDQYDEAGHYSDKLFFARHMS